MYPPPQGLCCPSRKGAQHEDAGMLVPLHTRARDGLKCQTSSGCQDGVALVQWQMEKVPGRFPRATIVGGMRGCDTMS